VVRWTGLKDAGSWVAFHHGYTATDTKMLVYNKLDRWSLPAADQVVTSAAAFVNELERKSVPTSKIHVRHMPIRKAPTVSEDRKSKLRRELGLTAETRVLLSVGRLSREKGQADLLRAFSRVREMAAELPLRLVLVGEGI